MRMKLVLISALSILSFSVFAQSSTDPVLLSVGNDKVTLSEFESIYRKNNNKDQKIDKKSLDEYIELFINFRLKVREAKELGFDTTANFRNEFNGYKKQLSQPYLKDKNAEEKMLKEAYERLGKDLKVSHILIKAKSDCLLPEDTIELYNKTMQIRGRLDKEKFEDVASQVSEDDYSKNKGGELGWFTALMWAYSFESVAYNLKPGQVSMPVRTSYGYHLIKLQDSRQAKGEVKVAHIFVNAPDNDTAAVRKGKIKIDQAYQKLKGGAAFKDLVTEFSDDKQSAASGGEMPWFGIGKMVGPFEEKAFSLTEKESYTEPFKTKYGYHIVKLIDKRGQKPYDQAKEELFKQIQRNPRYKNLADLFVNSIKAEYNFQENPAFTAEVKKLENPASKQIKFTDFEKISSDWVFAFGNKKTKTSDLIEFMKPRLGKAGEFTLCQLREKHLNPLIQLKALMFAEENLEVKYPEYKALLNEYRDGILLFDLMDKKVWTKSVEDSVGLKSYYDANKENYKWKERVEVVQFLSGDKDVITKVQSAAAKILSGKSTPASVLSKFNKKAVIVTAEDKLYEKGDNSAVDSLGWKPETGPVFKTKDNYSFYLVKGVRPIEAKDFKDAKGMVISDYQTYLEKTWLTELRKKYPVQLDKSVLYSLINK